MSETLDPEKIRRYLASAISRSPMGDRYRQHHGPEPKHFEMADDILSEFNVTLRTERPSK